MKIRIVHKEYCVYQDVLTSLKRPLMCGIEQAHMDLTCRYFDVTDQGSLKVFDENNILKLACSPGEWITVYRLD